MNLDNKLAIVIPLYKKVFFEETLKSIYNQTDKRFNLYIGNDLSPFDFNDIIDKYKMPFTYKVFQENLGGVGKLVEQWDRCISLTNNEEYIQILGDDDCLSPNFVEIFYKKLKEKKTFDLLRFKMIKIDSDSNVLEEFNQIDNISSKEHLLNDLNQIYWISISENVFSRSVYERIKIKNYPLAWRSDAMMVFEFGLKNIEISNEAYVAIRRSEVQLTMDVNPKILRYKKNAMHMFYIDLLEKYAYSFNKDEKKIFLRHAFYYSEKINLKILFTTIKNSNLIFLLKLLYLKYID